MNKPALDFFNRHAEALAQQYNALDRARVHADLLALLPEGQPLAVLDIGAGSGADAAMFADMGHRVVANEPAAGLRDIGKKTFKNKNIKWNKDVFPDAGAGLARLGPFDVVTSVGVFQYISEEKRPSTLNKMFLLASTGGFVEIQYPTPASREHQFTVAHGEIAQAVDAFNLAARPGDGMEVVSDRLVPDFSGRKALDGSDLSFRTVILRRKGVVGPSGASSGI